MTNRGEANIQANCPKCRKPAKKLGLAETIYPDGWEEANWVFACDDCDYSFDVPKNAPEP